MRTISAVILVSLAAGGLIAGGFSWKVAFAIAAIGQCFVAYLEKGRPALTKNAIFVLLVAGAPTLLIPCLPDAIQIRISASTADWISCIVSFLVFIAATLAGEKCTSDTHTTEAQSGECQPRSAKVISARITSG